jgi:hypothetical protein
MTHMLRNILVRYTGYISYNQPYLWKPTNGIQRSSYNCLTHISWKVHLKSCYKTANLKCCNHTHDKSLLAKMINLIISHTYKPSKGIQRCSYNCLTHMLGNLHHKSKYRTANLRCCNHVHNKAHLAKIHL